MTEITFTDIKNARARIAPYVYRTPLERSKWLSKRLGRDIYLKLECFQTTGSFKLRGAMAKLTALNEEERRRGVLTVSAGNHGLAVAHGAERLGLQASIVVPESASRAKVAAISRHPVELIERGANYDEAERAARELERQTGKTFISPYNDAEVIAGQGTIALELFEDFADLDAIVVPVGGGGLIAGIAIAAKHLNPEIKIYGVEPTATPTMLEAVKAGQVVEIAEDETVADGLAGNIELGSITFSIIFQFVDEILTVNEDEIKNALAAIAREEHIMVEGSAAVSLAAVSDERLAGQRVAAIVSGRNITLDLFSQITASYHS